MNSKLYEDSRTQLINKSKKSPKGKQRFDRRVKSKVANSVKQFNDMDMNKLFKDNILSVNIHVKGETDDYIVNITFGGFLDILYDRIKDKEQIEVRDIVRSLLIGFNRDDVFIGCSCPDFYYRFGYWTTKNKVGSGAPQSIPSDITNPNDTLGSGCKHILLVLNNNSWLIKVASVINNYINYMKKYYKKAYADIIYPAIYKKAYEEPVQLSIDDTDELVTDTDTLSKINDEQGKSGQFKQGNTQGIRFAKEDNKDDQYSMLDDDMKEL